VKFLQNVPIFKTMEIGEILRLSEVVIEEDFTIDEVLPL